MNPNDVIVRKYLADGDYMSRNPTWDSEDAPWKTGQLLRLLVARDVQPASIADVGCGAGAVLAELRRFFPEATLEGYEVAPDAQRFWKDHAAKGINFILGDFFERSEKHYDLILVFDVLEHLQDPFGFLAQLRGRGRYYAFHFPLDLCALSVLREQPLLHSRSKVGHIHYFTKGLAVALLEECGYRIIDASYTGAAFSAPQRSLRSRLAALPRRIGRIIARDFSVRLFGGETLMVLAGTAE